MLKRITLINFMSHKETVIEPAEGLTVIAGENNCGKSAIVSAIQCVCSNATGDYMVRHGEKECRVILETDDGHVVEWKRANKKVSYVVNGEAIDRTRGKVPEKVEAVLRMNKVVAENEEFDVHFGEQKNPIFLLNGTSGQRAAFFASSSDAAKLIEMQSLHKSKLSDANRNLKEFQKRETNFLLRLDKLKPLDQIHSLIQTAEHTDSQLQQSNESQMRLTRLLHELQIESQNVKCFSATAASLTRLPGPPEFVEHSKLDDLIEEFESSARTNQIADQELSALSKIESPPQYGDASRLQTLLSDLRSCKTEFDGLLKRSVYLQIPDPPEHEDEKRIDETICRLEKLNKELSLFEKTCGSIPKLDSLQPVTEEEPLAKQIVRQNQVVQEISELQKMVDDAARQTQAAHQEFHAALDASGTCPTCGQELQKTEIKP